MNSRERVLKTLKGEMPDRVPLFEFIYQQAIYEATINKKPAAYNVLDAIDCSRVLGVDLVQGSLGAPEGWTPEFIKDDTYIDEFGTVYQITDASWPLNAPVDFPIKDKEDYKKYKWPDPTIKSRTYELIKGLERAKREIAVSGTVYGPFTQVWLMMGPEKMLINFYDEPDLMKNLMNDATDYLIEVVKAQDPLGIDVMLVAEDLGSNSGGFVSNEMFHEFILPYIERLLKTIKTPIFLHSCGGINEYMEDLIAAGIDAVHPLQRMAGMDLKTIKEKYGGRVTIVGNVNSSSTLPYGSPEDVEREVLECLDIGKPGGRYMMSSDHSLHPGIPVENIFKMFETTKKNGRYESL